MKILDVTRKDDHLVLDISGEKSRFHYLWLRDNCPESISPNGQRLHESNTIDPDVRPASVTHSEEQLSIVWDDASTSSYPVEFLNAWAYDGRSEARRNDVLWDSQVGAEIQPHDYAEVCEVDTKRAAWLADVERYGFSLLCNVPTIEETIFDVVDLFGFVRETNYGRLFEVRTEKRPSNLAYTPVPLSVHTDNPYRNPCPTLQLLHCLVQAEHGGITAIVDGFSAAEQLRNDDPEAFSVLTENEVQFRYESEDAYIDSTGCIISVDAAGRPIRIRINNRSLAPLRLDFNRIMPFYKALFRFRGILEDERWQYRFRLESGDLIVFDNERVLHGRVGESVGKRHLQGCYADRDGLLSTLSILEGRGAWSRRG